MDKEAHFVPLPSVRDSLRSVDGYAGMVMFDEAALRP